MSNIGNRLRETRIKKGIKQGELAELLQCSSKAISRYEKNENLEKVYDFVKMCECLDADINYIVTGVEKSNGKEITVQEQQILMAYRGLIDSEKRIVDFILGIGEYDIESNQMETEPQKIYLLPVYQQDVAAGSGQLGFDQKHEMEEFCDPNMPQKISYGIKISGTSMQIADENNIPDGSTILVTTEFEYDELIGEAVVVNIGGVLVCKEYNIAEDGHLWLKSRNRDKSDEDRHIYDIDRIKIIGKVVKVISS